jgi:hypothetical protein
MKAPWLATLALGFGVAACSSLPAEPPPGDPRSGDSPGQVVTRAVVNIVAHDLPGASRLVCAGQRDPRAFPFLIGGIFQPVGALPDYDVARTLSIIGLDASRVTVTETERLAVSAEVRVGGTLVEHFDPAAVEALFRTMAAESGQPLDQALLDETMAKVSAGDVELPVDESVRVVQENGAWKICPPLPTP